MYEIIEIWTEISITYLNNPEIEPEPRKLGNRKPTFVKKAMEKSHDSLCPLCGVKMSNVSVKVGSNKLANQATWEHLLDLSIGGKNTEGNSAIICNACNLASARVMQTYLICENFQAGSLEWKDKFISNNLNIIKLQRYIAWKFNSIWFGNIDIDPLLGKIWKSLRFGNLGNNTNFSEIKTSILQTSKVLPPNTKTPIYIKIKNKLFSSMRFLIGHNVKEIEAINLPVEGKEPNYTMKTLETEVLPLNSTFDFQLEKHDNDEILTFLKEQISKRINPQEYSVISPAQLRKCGKLTIDNFEITWNELFGPFTLKNKRIPIHKKMALLYSKLGFSVEEQTMENRIIDYKITLYQDVLSEKNSSHSIKHKKDLKTEKRFPRIKFFNDSGPRGLRFPQEPEDMASAILKLSTIISPGDTIKEVQNKLSEVTGIPKSRINQIVTLSLKEYLQDYVLIDDVTSSNPEKYFQSIKKKIESRPEVLEEHRTSIQKYFSRVERLILEELAEEE